MGPIPSPTSPDHTAPLTEHMWGVGWEGEKSAGPGEVWIFSTYLCVSHLVSNDSPQIYASSLAVLNLRRLLGLRTTQEELLPLLTLYCPPAQPVPAPIHPQFSPELPLSLTKQQQWRVEEVQQATVTPTCGLQLFVLVTLAHWTESGFHLSFPFSISTFAKSKFAVHSPSWVLTSRCLEDARMETNGFSNGCCWQVMVLVAIAASPLSTGKT